MPEYDAFGREIGEDPLQGWREGTGAQPPRPAPPEPRARERAPATVTAGDPLGGAASAGDPLGGAASAGDPPGGGAPAAPPRAAPGPAGPWRSGPGRGLRPRRRRRGVRVLVLLAVLWVGFNLVAGLAGTVEEAIRSVPIPDVGPTPAADAPAGLAAGSLLRPAAFERALAEIRRRGGGRLQSLRVAPESIIATLVTDRGSLVTVQVSAAEGYRRLSETGPGFSASTTIPYGRLDPRAPQRLTRAAAGRLGRPARLVNYLVPTFSGGKVVWGAYFKTGAIFLADARGRITRRLS